MYVRERHVLSLESAIRKMTSFPATRFGFKKRGLLKKGYQADVVVFDPNLVIDRATTKDPEASPVGIEDVWINGTPVLFNSKATKQTPGQVIRRTVRLR